MSEVKDDTEHKQDKGSNNPVDLNSLSPEELAQIQEFLARQAAQTESLEPTTPEVVDEDSTHAPISETPHAETQSRSESPLVDPQDRRKRSLSKRTLVITSVVATAAAIATVVWGVASANRSGSGPIVTTSAPATPTPVPSPSETPQPTPSETSTEPSGESQRGTAEALLKTKNAEFNAMPLSLRQLAVDWKYSDIVGSFTDPNGTLSYPFISNSPYTKGKGGQFASAENKDLIEFDPVNIAERAETDNKKATAQAILNQLTFAKAAAWGQIKTPMTRQLDQNTAANMVNGYFYDPLSDGAQKMIADIQRSKQIKIFGPEAHFKPDSSSELKTHTFDEYGNLEYRVINFNDGDGDRYVIVTPLTTEFTGPDPGGSGEIVTLEITKWLVLQEGTGTEDTQGRLKHLR